jgi:phage tail protein X
MSAVAANREIYQLLKNGVRVPMPDPEGDGETVEVVRVIDWDEPANNDFLLCSQFWVTGEMHTRRADLAEVLEYTQYRNFEGVIEKAKLSCFNSGHRIEDHFVDVTEMIEIGKGGQRTVIPLGFINAGEEDSND